jgi:hypothetical protein
LLQFLGCACLVWTFLFQPCCLSLVIAPISKGRHPVVSLVYPCFVGLILSLTALLLARRDLGLMRTGLMDSQGRKATERAHWSAVVGLVINLLCLLLFARVIHDTLFP